MSTPRMLRVKAPDPASHVRAASAAERPRRAAVLICHGMGQQVPFETIDLVARQICELAAPSENTEQSLVQVEQVAPDDGQFLPRAVVSLTAKNGEPVVAHFYEGYWAPITEGKVTLRDTLSFLFGAGWRGIKFSARDGIFDRFMFGERQEFTIPSRTIIELSLAFWSVILLSVMFVGWWVFAGALASSILRVSWPSATTLASILSVDVALVAALLVTGLCGFILSRVFAAPRVEARQSLEVCKPPLWTRAGSIGVALAATVLSVWAGYRSTGWLDERLLGNATLFAAVSVLCIAFGVLLFRVRWFLIQFPGDVAAYVSAYKVSKFQQTRSEIQAACRRVARFVYELGYDVPGTHRRGAQDQRYDDILIVGHSLGSVVAYDTLNDAINRDIHENGWYEGSPRDLYHVVDRTRLLLTFGSPLDKTAFIFRTQQDHERFEIREGLAATMQPLILDKDYAYRRARWINIWSRWDWVSGRLDYYDKPDAEAPPAVVNVQAKTSWRPDLGHTGYWDQPLVRGVIYATLTGELPNDVDSATADSTDAEHLRAVFSGVTPPRASSPDAHAVGTLRR